MATLRGFVTAPVGHPWTVHEGRDVAARLPQHGAMVGAPDETLEVTWTQLSEGLTRAQVEDRAKTALADVVALVKEGCREPIVIVEAI